MTRIAHLTDLHLSPKRPERSRRFEAAVGSLSLVGARHLVLTGDLTAAGREEEWDELARVLAPLPSHVVTIVAGNHDLGRDETWADVLRRRPLDLGRFAVTSAPGTVIEVGGDCYVVPLSTQYEKRALAFRALGRLGQEQLHLARVACRLAAGRPVIFLVHHGPESHGPLMQLFEGLTDARALWQLLEDCPNAHVLCGHSHEERDEGRVHSAAALADRDGTMRLYDVGWWGPRPVGGGTGALASL